jgi:hypothetical protein
MYLLDLCKLLVISQLQLLLFKLMSLDEYLYFVDMVLMGVLNLSMQTQICKLSLLKSDLKSL